MQAARPKDTFCPTFNYRESLKGPLKDLVPQTHRLYPIVKKLPPLLLDLGFLARVYPEYAQSVEELGSRITAYRKVLPPPLIIRFFESVGDFLCCTSSRKKSYRHYSSYSSHSSTGVSSRDGLMDTHR